MNTQSAPESAAADKAPREATAEVECVYLGQRELAKGTLAEAWIPLALLTTIKPDDWDKLEQAHSCFSIDRKAKVPAVVGGIYHMQVELVEDRINKARTGTRKFLRLYPDSNTVARLDGIDAANKAKHKSAAQLDKLKSHHALEGDLRNLRAHYHRLPYQDRVAFELTVLSFIRKRG